MITKVDVLLDQIDRLLIELNEHFEYGHFFIDFADDDSDDND